MTTKEKSKTNKTEQVVIAAPNFGYADFSIVGMAPYVQLKFAEKTKDELRRKHELGSQSRKGAKKEARDFDEDYRQAFHVSDEGWHGIPASAFRKAMISACRTVGFQMTKAKLSIFVEPDGFDRNEGTPLIRIEGEPEMKIDNVKNQTGVVDLRVRAMWREWSAMVRVRFDADFFSITDVSNLLARAGLQVGIGEGRPDSKNSAGMDWGLFKIE